MKGKILPFRCVSDRENEVLINLKASGSSRILGAVILDKVKSDSQGVPVTCSLRKGEAKIRNLSREGLSALRQWTYVKALDLLTKSVWILEAKTYRYAPGRYDGHDRLCWRLIAYPSDLQKERLSFLDLQGLHGQIQLFLL